MLSDQDLAAIEERCRKATPGPWIVARGPEWYEDYQRDLSVRCEWRPPVKGAIGHELLKISGVNHGSGPNAAFIASSREDVPKLIEEVKRLREALWLLEGVRRGVEERLGAEQALVARLYRAIESRPDGEALLAEIAACKHD